MAVFIHWQDPCTLVARYEGKWTATDVTEAMARIHAAIDAVSHPVDVIHDWRGTTHFPPTLLGIARDYIGNQHPRTRSVVHLGVNVMFTSLWDIAARVRRPPAPYFYAATPSDLPRSRYHH